MIKDRSPKFQGGRNIAMKIPAHEFNRTVDFYRYILNLPVIDENDRSVSFEFGEICLWIDKVNEISHSEIWLEIQTENVREASKYLSARGIIRRDEIEQLPEDFDGFWITNPGNIIHLVSPDS